jgi:queuosine precursor transporter
MGSFMIIAYVIMIFIVTSSNYLVQFPINDWLTWGAFPYPVSFLVTELTNRYYGSKAARQVVYVGFILAVFLSFWLATIKIAAASGSAFLISQLLDILIFNRLRRAPWWYSPFFASVLASSVDTAIFWTVAFWGESLPVFTWALGDLAVKLILDITMLIPFRYMMQKRPLWKPSLKSFGMDYKSACKCLHLFSLIAVIFKRIIK